jgi:uncharacterized protein involved in type VI secretion and phage assembly
VTGIIDAVKKVAENELKKVLTTELGVVTSVFPHSDEGDNDNYECNVKLKDKDLELRRVPMTTQHVGLSNPLHVGDLVVVTFINGDINAPVILGRLYNDEDRPPVSKQEEIIYKPPYSKNSDLKRINIVLPGPQGENLNIELHDNVMTTQVGKSSVTMRDAGVIELKTEPGKKCIIVLDDKGLRIDSEGDVQIHSGGSLTVECDKDLTFKAQNIVLETQQALKLSSGTTLDIKSSAPFNIKSDALGTVEASGPLTVKSSAILTVQGSLVKIN